MSSASRERIGGHFKRGYSKVDSMQGFYTLEKHLTIGLDALSVDI